MVFLSRKVLMVLYRAPKFRAKLSVFSHNLMFIHKKFTHFDEKEILVDAGRQEK